MGKFNVIPFSAGTANCKFVVSASPTNAQTLDTLRQHATKERSLQINTAHCDANRNNSHRHELQSERVRQQGVATNSDCRGGMIQSSIDREHG